MIKHFTGKSTVLTWSDYQFQTNLDEGDLHADGLETGAVMRRRAAFPRGLLGTVWILAEWTPAPTALGVRMRPPVRAALAWKETWLVE